MASRSNVIVGVATTHISSYAETEEHVLSSVKARDGVFARAEPRGDEAKDHQVNRNVNAVALPPLTTPLVTVNSMCRRNETSA